MKKGKLYNAFDHGVIANKVLFCRGLWSRLRGLLGTSTLADEAACWIVPCNSVHTIGMRYPIDVYFLNKKNEIISIVQNMKPNRLSPVFWKAYSVVEMKSNGSRKLKKGDRFLWEEAS